MKHVCYVLPPFEHYSPQTGGALATISLNHTLQLQKRGYRVSVLVPQFRGEKYDVGEVKIIAAEQREDLNVVRRFFSSKVRGRAQKYDLPYFEYYLSKVVNILKQIKPDVIITFIDLSSPLEIKTALPQSQVIAYLQNEQRSMRQSQFYLNKNLDALDQIWGVSDYISEDTKKQFARAAHKVSTLYNGVDCEVFHPRENYGDEPRGDEPVRVLYVGRTDATKGTDLVPQAVAALRAQGENVELTVAGSTWFYDHEKQNDRPYIRELRAAMEAAGARYLGHVARPDLPTVFRAADISCVPSRFNEPFGLTALEGMASGCALIAARRGGLPEFCAGAALLIESESSDAGAPGGFAHALSQLVKNRDLLRQYKEKSRARALEFEWSVIANRVEELLNANKKD